MNKPAPKEPSMDEILSSIRQIIADDDAGGAPKRPAGLGSSPLVQPAPPVRPALNPLAAARPAPAAEPELDPEPLALSAAQIVSTDEADAPEPMDFSDVLGAAEDDEAAAFSGPAELIDPEDVAFEPDPEPQMAVEEEEDDPMAMFSVEADPEPEPMMPEMPRVEPTPVAAAAPRPVAPQPPPRPEPRPQPSVAQTAPMPDPTLSSDMAEELLDTTTQAAVKSTFSRLNGMSMVTSGVTLEEMMREMLRPMLKSWLDENLPSVVERMVEREISRISRGGGN